MKFLILTLGALISFHVAYAKNETDGERNNVLSIALSDAIKKQNLRKVELLLEHNLKINNGNNFDYLPLCEAILQGNSEIIKLLIDKGAKPYIACSKIEKRSAFSLATASNDFETLNLLTAGDNTKMPKGRKASACSIENNEFPTDIPKTPKFNIPTGHGLNYIRTLSVSSDGRLLLTAAQFEDTVVTVLDQKTAGVVQIIEVPGDGVASARLSSNGKFVITANQSGEVIVWNTLSGKPIRKFLLEEDADVSHISFTSDDKELLIGYNNGLAQLWQWETCDRLVSISHGTSLTTAAISHDGNFIYTAGFDGNIQMWEVGKYTPIRSFFSQAGKVESIAISKDNKWLAFSILNRSKENKSITTVWQLENKDIYETLYGEYGETHSLEFDQGDQLLISDAFSLRVFNINSKSYSMELNYEDISSAAFMPDSDCILVGSFSTAISFKKSGEGFELCKEYVMEVNNIVGLKSSNGQFFIGGESLSTLNPNSGIENITDYSSVEGISAFDISTDEKKIAIAYQNMVEVIDIERGLTLMQFEIPNCEVISLKFFSNDEKVATAGWTLSGPISEVKPCEMNKVWVWDINKKELSTPFRMQSNFGVDRFIDYGSNLIVQKIDGFQSWNYLTGKETNIAERFFVYSHINSTGQYLLKGYNPFYLTDSSIQESSGEIVSSKDNRKLILRNHSSPIVAAFISETENLAFTGDGSGTVNAWNTIDGELLTTFTTDHPVKSISYLKSHQMLAVLHKNGQLSIWSMLTNSNIASIAFFGNGSWIMADAEGRFDTNSLLGENNASWIMPDDPLTPIPLEIFMREYFEPSLLQRKLKCSLAEKIDPTNCSKEFTSVPALDKVNRVQPIVNITEISLEDPDIGSVKVTVKVAKNYSTKNSDKTNAYDLRLLLNGHQVACSHCNQQEQTTKRVSETSLEETRATTQLIPDNKESNTIVFKGIKIPTNIKQDETLTFSAYAFNDDKIRSGIASKTYQPSTTMVKRPQRAFVLSIGVSGHKNSKWNLKYAANDATLFSSNLADSLRATKLYNEVLEKALISTWEEREGTEKLVLNNANKSNIRTELKKLSETVTPDDLVLISYSSHGIRKPNGEFYLFTSDVNTAKETAWLDSTISTEELGGWLSSMNARRTIIVIDSCYSAATISKVGFKPGPMGSSGLGQLAYDKGFQILTSSRADELSIESSATKNGLLTYTLITEGLVKQRANKAPKDSKITVKEWLGYSVLGVQNTYNSLNLGTKKAKKFEWLDTGETIRDEIQKPVLFDFRRNNRETAIATFNKN